ncbi:MAG: DUF4430 domain-containing protein [bacterium]
MQGKKKTIALVVALVVCVAVLAGVWFASRKPAAPAPTVGEKHITVEVIYDDVDKSFPLTTSETTLAGALKEATIVTAYTDSDWGMYITGVDERDADSAAQEWWSITKNGEMTETGADGLILAEGDHYELTLTQGYEMFEPEETTASEPAAPVEEPEEETPAGIGITVEIIYDDVDKEIPLTTHETTLAGALVEATLVTEYSDSAFGMYITGVDDRDADSAAQEWWCITKDGEMTETGADGIVLAEGDHYELTLKVGYDF